MYSSYEGINIMTYGIALSSSFSNSSGARQIAARPRVTSYDSGYEHSFDRYVEAKLLLLDTDNQANGTPATFAAAS